jgi:hypothetical protein
MATDDDHDDADVHDDVATCTDMKWRSRRRRMRMRMKMRMRRR